MLLDSRISLFFVLALAAACASESTASTTPAPTPTPTPGLRPGVKDSSKAFQGTASPNETSFWEAVRTGDDAARAKAVEAMRKDVAADPSNAYSAFLIGGNNYMPPSGVLKALNAGQVPTGAEQQQDPPDLERLLSGARDKFTDPLYKGFAASLLSAYQFGKGDFENGGKNIGLGVSLNIPASAVTRAVGSILQKDLKGANDAIWEMFDFCAGAPLDRNNPDMESYVDRANKSDLAHRECYSGYHATHGTEGSILIAGDLAALTGNPTGAARMYAAMKRAANYNTWGLKALAERRVSGELTIVPENIFNVIGCASCHVDQIK
jgi:hypothetical protein